MPVAQNCHTNGSKLVKESARSQLQLVEGEHMRLGSRSSKRHVRKWLMWKPADANSSTEAESSQKLKERGGRTVGTVFMLDWNSRSRG